MRKWVVRLGIAAALVAVVLVSRATIFKPDPVPVEVAEVEVGRVEETVTNSRAGSVRARRRAKLSPETGGKVVAIPFREGERVRKGDVVLKIDDRSQRARLELAQRELDSFRAESRRACLAAERAGREFERTLKLADEKIVSTDLLDRIESGKQTADAACLATVANVARAQASVAVARADLEKTEVRSPFAGVVAEVSAEIGEWTTPSPPALPVPPVIDILDPNSIYISAPMDEVDSARIRPGLEVRVTIDSHRGRSFSGRVVRVAPYVLDLQEQNRTVEIEVTLDDDELAATLLPGTSADVELILQVHEKVLRIATSALMAGHRVLVFTGSKLEARQVQIGLRNWDFTEIASGLEARERVVVALDRPEIVAGAEAVLADTDPGS